MTAAPSGHLGPHRLSSILRGSTLSPRFTSSFQFCLDPDGNGLPRESLHRPIFGFSSRISQLAVPLAQTREYIAAGWRDPSAHTKSACGQVLGF